MQTNGNIRQIFRTSLWGALLLLLCVGSAMAQKSKPTVIQGHADFAAGNEIRLIVFDDLLTYHKRVAASCKIDKKGSFKLVCEVKQPTLVQLAIRTSKAEFYIEPEKEYNLNIDMDPQLFDILDPMAYGGFLQIRNYESSPNDLNYRINRYEYVSADIVDFFAPNIVGDISGAQFDSITKEIKARFPLEYAPENFYKSYVYYSFASLQRVLYQKNRDSLYLKYLDSEYVLYENPAYMSFLSGFYDNYFLSSPSIPMADLLECINKEGHLLPLFNLVGKDKYLVNERIREVAIIRNLMQLFDNEKFNKTKILTILQEMAQTSHFEEHRAMATNAMTELQRFNAGTMLPAAKMKEVGGANFNPSSLQGKWVYIQFFSTSCPDCIREMLVIKQLQQKFGDRIAFVSISLDFNFGHFIQFKEKYRQFDWQFVHFNDAYEWLDEMQITTLPDNILIAPDGSLSRRYAPDISKDLSIFLARLLKVEEDNTTPLNPQN